MRFPVLRSLAALAVCAALLTLASLRNADQKPTGQPEQKAKAVDAPKQAKPSITMERFKEEWKEVRAKYPSVAAAYLESVEYIVDSGMAPLRPAQRRQFALLNERLLVLGFPFRCRWVCESKEPEEDDDPVPQLCPPCRLPTSFEEEQSYAECLEKRIACLH